VVVDDGSEFRPITVVELGLTGWGASRGGGGAVCPRNWTEVGCRRGSTFTGGSGVPASGGARLWHGSELGKWAGELHWGTGSVLVLLVRAGMVWSARVTVVEP
jgi:hypothetical protein